MVRCSSCASEVADSSRFCPACGVAVESEAFATRTVAVSTPRATPSSPDRRTSSQRHTSASSPGRFAPGHLLGGRYRIVAMLGKGAYDPSLEEPTWKALWDIASCACAFSIWNRKRVFSAAARRRPPLQHLREALAPRPGGALAKQHPSRWPRKILHHGLYEYRLGE